MMDFEIGDYDALREALRKLCEALERRAVPSGKVFDSRLVANELITNELRHGGGRAYLRAELCGDELRIFVRGARGYRPPDRSVCSDADSESGRGLFLVDSVSVSRGYSEKEGISVVICMREEDR